MQLLSDIPMKEQDSKCETNYSIKNMSLHVKYYLPEQVMSEVGTPERAARQVDVGPKR